MYFGQILHVKNAQQAQCLLLCLFFLFPIGGQAQHRRTEVIPHAVVHANQHVVQHCQRFKQADILKRAGNAQLVHFIRLFAAGVYAAQQNMAAGGLVHVGQQVEYRRFTGAVRADQPADFILADHKIKIVHRCQAAKIDAQMPHFQHGGLAHIPLGDDAAGHFNQFCLLFTHG
ncbi:hypothetical protein SDC9_190325 [bioreactor metagenome]|uniref:Uncharacterized protein n=1 Tax=bioreactor metagenome TaxID=1076179 RepID=A0A645HUW8_9ZZZZ